jgi:hypothetical protein
MAETTRMSQEESSNWFKENLGAGGMIFRKPRLNDSASSPSNQMQTKEELAESDKIIAQEVQGQISLKEPMDDEQ